jgi:hypothetical protein
MIVYQPEQPVGTMILFPDGNGLLKITHVFNTPHLGRPDDIPQGLVDHLLDQGIAVVMMDAPADHRSMLGINGWHGPNIFRLSSDHARDVGAVIDYLKQQEALPVWLGGIRMGAFSATTAAIHLQQEVAGLVIAGGITRCPRQRILLQLCPDGLMGMPLHEVTVPTLILSGGDSLPEPLLAAALHHSPSIRFQTFPTVADFETGVGWFADRAVLPGISDGQISREMAEFMRSNPVTPLPVLTCERAPAELTPLEIYLVGCSY